MIGVAPLSANKVGNDAGALIVASRLFRSCLIMGTGKYADYAVNALAAEAAGVDAVTVALRRVNLSEENRLAKAMEHAAIAGSEVYFAGRMTTKRHADPTSPLAGLL